jgi:deoxyribodipyrimidine photolyase-related protein
MKVICLLGDQLFNPSHLPVKPNKEVLVFMREDRFLCTRFKYHKHKLIFFLSAMRRHAELLRKSGYQVHYEKLDHIKEGAQSSELIYTERLITVLRKCKATELLTFDINDKFFATTLEKACALQRIPITFWPNPMFLTPRAQLTALLGGKKKPFMKSFYEAQRKRLKVLVEADGEPTGGKWSFDEDNRDPLPAGHLVPEVPQVLPGEVEQDVMKFVAKEFADHPGAAEEFWLPTTREGALAWAKRFFTERLVLFGPYEDALSQDQAFLYHSVLTPFLNTGLLTPQECLDAALKKNNKAIPLNSLEGFVRQLIGWREFVHGIYRHYSEVQETKNFFGHRGRLSSLWYTAQTGIEPLDDVIRKTLRYGYAHHIERLMVVGSLMLLLEIEPQEAHRWFMEMFVDSADWVMGPNVYGMALFSDGGLFATKPYFCGSNYYRKMGPYKKGGWQAGVDGLYWGFVDKNRAFFLKNPRTSMMVRTYDKFPPAKQKELAQAAKILRAKLVN